MPIVGLWTGPLGQPALLPVCAAASKWGAKTGCTALIGFSFRVVTCEQRDLRAALAILEHGALQRHGRLHISPEVWWPDFRFTAYWPGPGAGWGSLPGQDQACACR